MARPVFLLTDFGVGGYYQGVMRGVIARIAPEARVHDLSHGIRQGDLRDTTYVLESAWDHLPEDAVVMTVVDPGVGTARRILALEQGNRVFVGPDNGCATLLFGKEPAPVLRAANRPDLVSSTPSATFHGRDVFSPLAAHLANGLALDDLGPVITDPQSLGRLEATRDGDTLHGEVLVTDPFGNLITTVRTTHLDPAWDPAALTLHIGEHRFTGLHRTFADVAEGAPVLYLGSTHRLELALRNADAEQTLDLGPGTPLRVTAS